MRGFIVILIITFVLIGCNNNISNERTGDYFGEELPGDSARMFAPGAISTNQNVRDLAISKDGNIIVYSLKVTEKFFLVEVVRKNGVWTDPEFTSFSGEFKDVEPFFSPIDDKLFFASNRPLEAGGKEKDYDIWYTERTGDKWGDPVNLGEPVNSKGNEFYPSITVNGTIYYTAAFEDSFGEKIYTHLNWLTGNINHLLILARM